MVQRFQKSFISLIPLITLIVYFVLVLNAEAVTLKRLKDKETSQKNSSGSYEDYINFLEKVYKTMEENYYQPIAREIFDRFKEKFKTKIYPQLQGAGKSIDFVRWRSAAFLVEDLRSQEDIFSAFYPPKPAQEYTQTALGVHIDLGIKGELKADGFKVTNIEPHSDAYSKGLRINDVILAINDLVVRKLNGEKIKELLNPLADSKVKIKFLSDISRSQSEIEVLSQEYFQQTIFMVPVSYPGIYCLEIRHFNKKTSEELLQFLQYFKKNGPIDGLILDLRGNPGGPPLAAREISSFFLPGGEQFAYFQRKGEEKSWLDVPVIPEQFHYNGPMVILINEKSGSSSELFSGILQKRGRTVLMGSNSAGQVMLKSMFNLDDGSMILLVTARGHHPDGSVFSFKGLTPDHVVSPEEQDKIIRYAANYLIFKNRSH